MDLTQRQFPCFKRLCIVWGYTTKVKLVGGDDEQAMAPHYDQGMQLLNMYALADVS